MPWIMPEWILLPILMQAKLVDSVLQKISRLLFCPDTLFIIPANLLAGIFFYENGVRINVFIYMEKTR